MDNRRFDALTKILTASDGSRRTILRSLGASALVGLLGRLGLDDDAEAKKRRKTKKKTPAFNQFGCLDIGRKCGGNSGLCCSGICAGKKPKKGKQDKRTCVAHNVGGCDASFDSCEAVVAACGVDGACFRTTGKASVCGAGGGQCKVCKKDSDCEAILGPGAACIVCPSGCPIEGTGCVAAA